MKHYIINCTIVVILLAAAIYTTSVLASIGGQGDKYQDSRKKAAEEMVAVNPKLAPLHGFIMEDNYITRWEYEDLVDASLGKLIREVSE